MRSILQKLGQQWYIFTSPVNSAASTVFERERLRKAHLLSTALFPLTIATIIGLLVTLFIRQLPGALIDFGMILLISGVAKLNRQGRLYLAGFIFILGYTAACSFGLLLANSINSITIAYDWVYLIIIPLFAGFILPFWAPFLFSALDIALILLMYGMIFSRHISQYFAKSSDQIALFIIAAFVIVSTATLTAIYVRSVEKAVIEADRAVELEHLHRKLAEAHHKLTEAYARLEELATHDPITGLLNHRALQQQLMIEVAASEKRNEQPLSVIFADLDHFKQVNDTWGHQVGDLVLRHLAECLRKNVRAMDTVGRYGGEEFVVVLPGQAHVEAMLMAERLRMVIAHSPFSLQDNQQIAITLSLGVATFPDDGRTLETIISAADSAMYQAKHNGRNCVCRASPRTQIHAA
jgi:diguanylate cyclase (GGDEF)-like protein